MKVCQEWNNLPNQLTLFRVTSSRVSSKGLVTKVWGTIVSCNDEAEGHPRRIPPAVRRSMAKKNGKVH